MNTALLTVTAFLLAGGVVYIYTQNKSVNPQGIYLASIPLDSKKVTKNGTGYTIVKKS